MAGQSGGTKHPAPPADMHPQGQLPMGTGGGWKPTPGKGK